MDITEATGDESAATIMTPVLERLRLPAASPTRTVLYNDDADDAWLSSSLAVDGAMMR